MVEDLIVKTTEASHPTSRLTPVISRTEPSADQEVHSQVTEATGQHLQAEVLTTTTHAATLIAVVVTLQAHAAIQTIQTTVQAHQGAAKVHAAAAQVHQAAIAVATSEAHAATQATQTVQAVLHALTQAQAQAHQ